MAASQARSTSALKASTCVSRKLPLDDIFLSSPSPKKILPENNDTTIHPAHYILQQKMNQLEQASPNDVSFQEFSPLEHPLAADDQLIQLEKAMQMAEEAKSSFRQNASNFTISEQLALTIVCHKIISEIVTNRTNARRNNCAKPNNIF